MAKLTAAQKKQIADQAIANAEKGLSTAVAGATGDIMKLGQADIPNMLKMITEKIKALKGNIPKENSTIGKDLPGFGEIAKINDVTTLIQAHSSVVGKAAAYKASAEALGANLSKYPFKLGGCSESQWVADIQVTLNVVANKAELDKLNKTKELLEANLSAEAKLASDLAKIQALILE